MKFSITKSELQNAISIVQKGASPRAALPILSGILVQAQEDALVLRATDLEFSIQYKVAALVEEEGEAVFPARLFSDIVKSLSDAAVRVSTEEGKAKIVCDSSDFEVRTLEAQDFPAFPEVETTATIEVPFPQFARMVKRVSRAVSKDETRAVLTGILVAMEDGRLRMVATDSYRLAVTEADVPGYEGDAQGADDSDGAGFEAVVAGTFLNEVASLPKSEEPVKLALAENQIVVDYGETTLVNRRIEGNYPNYKQLLPDSYSTRAVVDVRALEAGVKRASLLASSSSPMRFDLQQASHTIQIAANSDDIGSARENIVCEVEGQDVEIAFNSGYVLDGLSAVETDEVAFEVQAVSRPGVFRATGDEDYLYLIMPVRL